MILLITIWVFFQCLHASYGANTCFDATYAQESAGMKQINRPICHSDAQNQLERESPLIRFQIADAIKQNKIDGVSVPRQNLGSFAMEMDEYVSSGQLQIRQARD